MRRGKIKNYILMTTVVIALFVFVFSVTAMDLLTLPSFLMCIASLTYIGMFLYANFKEEYWY